MMYVDLNMVRTGVVKHPSEWSPGGYNEIQKPPQRYAILDHEELKGLLGFRSMEDLAIAHRGCIEEALGKAANRREGRWTESIAVGSEPFVHATRAKLGIKAHGREVKEARTLAGKSGKVVITGLENPVLVHRADIYTLLRVHGTASRAVMPNKQTFLDF